MLQFRESLPERQFVTILSINKTKEWKKWVLNNQLTVIVWYGKKIPGRSCFFGAAGANGAAVHSATIIWIFPEMRTPIFFWIKRNWPKSPAVSTDWKWSIPGVFVTWMTRLCIWYARSAKKKKSGNCILSVTGCIGMRSRPRSIFLPRKIFA